MNQRRLLFFLIVLTEMFVRFTVHGQVSSQSGEEIVAVAQSDDGSTLATVSSMGVIRIREVRSNRVVREMNAEGMEGISLNGCRRVFFLPAQRLGVLGFRELRIFDIKSGSRVATYNSVSGFDNIVSSGGRYFAFFNRGLTEIVDLFTGKTLARRAIACHRAMDFSADGKYLFHYLEDRRVIECMEVATGKIVYWLPCPGVQRIILRDGDRTLLAIRGQSVQEWRLDDRGAPKSEFRGETLDPDRPFVAGEKWLVLPGPLHKSVSVYNLEKPGTPPLRIEERAITGSGPSGNPNRFLLAKVSEVLEYNPATGAGRPIGGGVSDVYRSVCLSPDETRLFVGTEDGYIKYFDIRTGTYRGVYRNTGKPVSFLRFSDNGRQLEIGDNRNVEVFDLATDKIIRTYSRERAIPNPTVRLDKAGRLTATIIAGELSIARDAMSLRITTRTGDNKDYFIHESSSMLFDASTGGIDVLGLFSFGENSISPRQLSEVFYRPDLLPVFFSKGNTLQQLVAETSRRLRSSGAFPRVTLDTGEGKVQARVRSQGGGIGAVQVYLNDKLVSADAAEKGTEKTGAEMVVSVDPSEYAGFDPSRPNRISIKAFNATGDISSEKLHIELPPADQQPTGVAPSGSIAAAYAALPRLWVLTVGVSEYANPDLFLNFASGDAEDIYTALDVGGRILFDNRVHLYRLTSAHRADSLRPTASNIRRVLGHISENAGRDDVVLLYFAGHGQSSPDGGPFYFLTSEARGFAEKYPAREAITDEDLMRTFVNSKCEKQLLILDACHSGQVIDRMISRGDRVSSIRAFERMHDRSAAFILASSSSSQKSWESSEFGQGVLTHFLLEGMRGPSLEDGVLTALKWMDYAKEGVEKYMEQRSRAGGAYLEPQVPRIFSSREVVPVAVAQFPDASSLSRIPINAPKPLAGPVTLLNRQLIDPLDLQAKINGLLRRSPPDRSPFYYMPDGDYPDSYRLVGSYDADPRTGQIRMEKVAVVRNKAEQATISVSGRFRSEEELMEELVSKFAAFCEKAKP